MHVSRLRPSLHSLSTVLLLTLQFFCTHYFEPAPYIPPLRNLYASFDNARAATSGRELLAPLLHLLVLLDAGDVILADPPRPIGRFLNVVLGENPLLISKSGEKLNAMARCRPVDRRIHCRIQAISGHVHFPWGSACIYGQSKE